MTPRHEKICTFAYAKTKAQFRCAVTTQLISTFGFAAKIELSLYFENSKFQLLTIFCGCTARFVSDLVGNPEDKFSHHTAHIISVIWRTCSIVQMKDDCDSQEQMSVDVDVCFCNSNLCNAATTSGFSAVTLLAIIMVGVWLTVRQ